MKRNYIYVLLLISLTGTSCKKYLDAKPNASLITPTSVSDLQGLLDNYQYMNIACSEAGEIASDNYYLTDTAYNALPTQTARNAYLWETDIFSGAASVDWQNEYTVVYNADLALESLNTISRNISDAGAWDNCKGSALFYRGKSFYEVAQIWAKAFDNSTAGTDLGIPLRLTSDYNVPSTRASVSATYNQIIADLKASIPLLPNNPVFIFRPSKPAAYGYLARTYLAMRDYSNARLYADSSLQVQSQLLDYNSLDTTASYAFASIQYTNPEEVIYSSCGISNYDLVFLWGRADSLLFASYKVNDLRKLIFYAQNGDGTHYFMGSYAGSYANFNGVATDEMYLTRAECEARASDIKDAMADLNTLLIKRWKRNTFVPYTATTSADAMNQVLTERRKELVYRMLRFTDIKRLNKEGANITQKHIIGGQTYILPPNDQKYALPIPINVLQLSGIQQNPGY